MDFWQKNFAGRLPALVMFGPIALSAAAHLGGLTETVPPNWVVQTAQLVIGTSLGARFGALPRARLRLALGLAALVTAISLALALGAAMVLHAFVGEPVPAVFLAFAPGGIAEMSLVALSLQVSVVFVSLHHVARIVLSVSVARAMSGLVLRRGGS